MIQTSIEVTQEDIANGIRHSSCKCPIALAVNRALRAGVNVGNDSFVLYRPSRISTIFLPENASSFIKKFDAGSSVEPFKFSVEI